MNNQAHQSLDMIINNSLKKIQFPTTWNSDEFNKILYHFQTYGIKNRQLKTPEKGLFIVAKLEDEPYLIHHLLTYIISEMYNKLEEEDYYNRVGKNEQTLPFSLSACDVALELHQNQKALDIVNQYSAKKILCITDFGKENIVKLPYHQKFDLVHELLRKRHQDFRNFKSKNVLYIINNCTKEELKQRYTPDTFYYIKSLTEMVVLTDI
jgi:hypothetical protein